MTSRQNIGVDDFPCGCIVTDASRQLQFANQYITDEFGWHSDQVVGKCMEMLVSPASRLFCESYVYPMLLDKGKCEEIQLTFLTSDGDRVPIIANVRQASDSRVVWSIFCAVNRDKLYQELVSARNRLEDQTRQLKKLSSVDDLTGLMNRRAFNDAVSVLFATAIQIGKPISLLLLDIDDFKRINDTYGHCFGDDVLRKVGACLLNTCRSRELVARFGGEEFVFALSGADAENARSFAEGVRAAITREVSETHPITVSIGVASRFSRHGPSYVELLSQADKALYEAKHTGKNKTVLGGNIKLSDHHE